MTAIQITLTPFEFEQCAHVGMSRFLASELQGLDPATSYKRGYLERMKDEVLGACGERVYAKAVGQYWDGSVNTFHAVSDAEGGVEVRTTDRDDGSLIIRDNDDPQRCYVLVTGTGPVFTIRGFILGADGRHPAFARNPHNHRPAWFVPQGYLQAMSTETP